MKNVIITEDVRFLGVGYSPSEDPQAVPDEVADGLIKIGCASIAEAGADQTEGSTSKDEE